MAKKTEVAKGKPYGNVRATYKADRQKTLFLHTLALFILFCLYTGMRLFNAGENLLYACMFVSGGMYILFAAPTLRYLIRPPRIDIYQHGVLVKGSGFWPWSQIKGWTVGRQLWLSFWLTDEQSDKDVKWPVGAKSYTYYPRQNNISVSYDVPVIISNVRAEEFCSKYFRSHLSKSESKEDTRPLPLQSKMRTLKSSFFSKTAFYGTYNPSLKLKIWTWLISALSLNTLYFLFWGPVFLPSQSWRGVGNVLVIIAVIAFVVALFKKKKSDKPRRKKNWGEKLLLIAVGPFLLPVMLSAGIVHAPGSLITTLSHQEYKGAIFIPAKSEAKFDEDCNGYKMKGPQLRQFFAKPFCLTKEGYDLLPETGVVFVVGKQNWFGQVIEDAYISKDPKIHQHAQKHFKNIFPNGGRQ